MLCVKMSGAACVDCVPAKTASLPSVKGHLDALTLLCDLSLTFAGYSEFSS